jgi:hypothetical protein
MLSYSPPLLNLFRCCRQRSRLSLSQSHVTSATGHNAICVLSAFIAFKHLWSSGRYSVQSTDSLHIPGTSASCAHEIELSLTILT